MIDNLELFLLLKKIEILNDDIIMIIYNYTKSNAYKNKMFNSVRLFNNKPRLFNNVPLFY
jgi:hypothetical protein